MLPLVLFYANLQKSYPCGAGRRLSIYQPAESVLSNLHDTEVGALGNCAHDDDVDHNSTALTLSYTL